MKECESCGGKSISDEHLYCPSCGKRLKESEERAKLEKAEENFRDWTGKFETALYACISIFFISAILYKIFESSENMEMILGMVALASIGITILVAIVGGLIYLMYYIVQK